MNTQKVADIWAILLKTVINPLLRQTTSTMLNKIKLSLWVGQSSYKLPQNKKMYSQAVCET